MQTQELSESAIQSQFYQLFHNTYPEKRGRLFCINNNSQNAVKGALNKAMGVLPGVADMAYLVPGGVIFLECKTPTGTQSASQRQFQALCHSLGIPYFIFRSVAEGVKIIEKYF